MTDQTLKIHSVQILNGLQFKSYDLKLDGKSVIISGKNETGKSSLIDLIRAGLSGGTKDDTELLHGVEVDGVIKDREKRGKIIIRVDDDEAQMEDVLTKNLFLEKASQLEVAGTSTPAAFLVDLLGAAFIDPIKFYNAPGEKRVEMAMKVIPLSFDRDLFVKIVGEKIKPNADPIAIIKYHYDRWLKERTEANGAFKKAKIRADDARRAVPIDDPEPPGARIAELEAERKVAADLYEAKKGETNLKRDDRKLELEAIRDASIKKASDDYVAALEEMDRKVKRFLANKWLEFQSVSERVDPELGALRDKAKNYEQIMAQHKMLHDLEVEEEQCKEDAEMKDKTVKEIEMVREALIDNDKLKEFGGDVALEIKEDDLWLDGVKWKHVNRAKKLLFSNTMAEMSCGKLKMILVDDMESLDKDNYKWQVEHMKKSGFQYVAGRVGKEGELTIKTTDEALDEIKEEEEAQ